MGRGGGGRGGLEAGGGVSGRKAGHRESQRKLVHMKTNLGEDVVRAMIKAHLMRAMRWVESSGGVRGQGGGWVIVRESSGREGGGRRRVTERAREN